MKMSLRVNGLPDMVQVERQFWEGWTQGSGRFYAVAGLSSLNLSPRRRHSRSFGGSA